MSKENNSIRTGGNNMIDNYMLYKNLPTLDLHGCNRYEAKIKVEEFINENIVLKNHLIIVIHGKGLNILKQEIHKYLKTNKKIINYKIDVFNDGQTIIEI